MWKAFGTCVLIGWGFGLMSSLATSGIKNGYDVVSAFGMGLIFALFGLMFILPNRKRESFAGAYMATAIFGGLVTFGIFYGSANP